MPKNYKRRLLYVLIPFLFFIIISTSTSIQANEGISTYYIRYDVQSSRNKIINDNLLMIPAKNDFRAEKFSQFFTTGVISATPGEPEPLIDKRIKENSLKTILVESGLKSVKIKDNDTVISYEGIINTPLHIIQKTYNEAQNNFSYKVNVEFSPLAFPDRWETLHLKYKFKKMFSNFFELFK